MTSPLHKLLLGLSLVSLLAIAGCSGSKANSQNDQANKAEPPAETVGAGKAAGEGASAIAEETKDGVPDADMKLPGTSKSDAKAALRQGTQLEGTGRGMSDTVETGDEMAIEEDKTIEEDDGSEDTSKTGVMMDE